MPGILLQGDYSYVGHRVAIFVRDPAGDYRRGQHSKQKAIHRLPGLNGEHIGVRLGPALIDFGKPRSLDEDAVTSGCNVLDAEVTVRLG